MDSGQTPNAMTTPSSNAGGGPQIQRGGADGVSVREPDNTEYYQSLQIVLGTVCGVFGLLGLLLVLSLLYRFYKMRRHGHNQSPARDQVELNSSISIDLETKHVPTILLLYAYDCSAHEQVVSSLAGFLIETFNCNVHLDMFEEQLISDRGLADWLVDRLQEVDYIIVLCSVGARLRCTKKRVRFKHDPDQKIPDYFALAVDYVAEKMRVERSKGLPMSRFIVAYMEYSTASDIPHQLETGAKFCLMKDIFPLFCHIHGTSAEPTKNGETYTGISNNTYEQSELGIELKVAIQSAKEFFKSNPNWVEDSMEVAPPIKSKSRHIRKSSLEPLLGDIQVAHDKPLNTHVDIHSRSIPPNIKHTEQTLTNCSLQNRQNSLPSSLSSHQTLSTPPLPNIDTSKSYESVQSPSRLSDLENPPCIRCGQEGLHDPYSKCKGQGRVIRGHGHNIDTEDDNSLYKGKSKSMPTVYNSSVHSSQTVFTAEVHKEWGDHMTHHMTDHEGKLSFSDSQDSGSYRELVMEDLERDLQSIIMPSIAKGHTSSYYGNRPRPLSDQFYPQLLPHLHTLGQTHILQPITLDAVQFCKDNISDSGTKNSDSNHGNVAVDEQMIQLQDIRL